MITKTSKILVVDDIKTMRRVIIRSLTENGYSNFVEADDGQTAWAQIEEANSKNAPFELIISDWNMPIVKGIQLLGLVRGNALTAKTPFLMVTAESESSQVIEAVTKGVSDYITKPFTTNALLEKLDKIAKKAA